MSTKDLHQSSSKLFSVSNNQTKPESLNNKPKKEISLNDKNQKSQANITLALMENKQVSEQDKHYVENLKNALKKACDENDIVSFLKIKNYLLTIFQLRNRVTLLESLLSAAQDEIEERDNAIIELNDVCEVSRRA